MNWPATVFLVSSLIGKRDEWCRGHDEPGEPRLSGQSIVVEPATIARRSGFSREQSIDQGFAAEAAPTGMSHSIAGQGVPLAFYRAQQNTQRR
jgi:hypothetical protein